MLCLEIRFKPDEPIFFISKCPFCGMLFHSKKASLNHYCKLYHETRLQTAMVYLINWISIKMLSINSIEHPFFKTFLLDPQFKIPNTKILRQLIIHYADIIFNQSLVNMKSQYLSIMIDGTSRWKHYFLSIILYSKCEYIYYKTKIVKSEDTLNISAILNDCIEKLTFYKKNVCSICSDNFSANKSACNFSNLKVPLYRQYCNCHCVALALSNLFGIEKPYSKLTYQIKLALRLLKKFNPPFLSNIKWKSLSICVDFICKNSNQLIKSIDELNSKKKTNKNENELNELKKLIGFLLKMPCQLLQLI